MSQHDFDIANQGFAAFRADLNNALKALGSTSSGTAEPATTYANQLWYETDTNTLHIRNEANSAWLDLMVIDQTTGSPSFTAGNVGIGTTTPSQPLTIQATTPIIQLVDSNLTTQVANIGGDNGNVTIDIDPAQTAAASFFSVNIDNTERLRIDDSGNLLVGKTTTAFATQGTRIGPDGVLTLTRDGITSLFINRLTNDGDLVELSKNGTTVGSIGVNSSRPYLAGGSSGIAVGGTNAAIFPADAGGTLADNLYDVGSLSVRWDDIYATNGTIQTSDRNEKQDIEELSEAELRVAVACKGLMRKYRWKDAVAEKGDDARIHFGIIAQDLQAAFAAEGLDAGRYAMFIHSTWTDEETGEERSRMGVRYTELLAFMIAAL